MIRRNKAGLFDGVLTAAFAFTIILGGGVLLYLYITSYVVATTLKEENKIQKRK